MATTPNLGLPLIDGAMTADVPRDMNALANAVDTAVEEALADVSIPDASLTVKGKTQLSSATNSTLEDRAATPKAVKTAYDEATAAKQLGVEQKANVVAALNSIGVTASTSETWAQLIPKIAAVIRATGNATAAQVLAGATFSNASANGLTGTMVNRGAVSQIITTQNGSYTIPSGYHNGLGVIQAVFSNLIAGNIRSGVNVGGVTGTLNEGPKYATGSASASSVNRTFATTNGSVSLRYINVTGLGFRPNRVLIMRADGTSITYNFVTYSKLTRNAEPAATATNFNYAVYHDGTTTVKGYYVYEMSGSAVSTDSGYVNDSGFLLPIPIAVSPYTWEAFGV